MSEDKKAAAASRLSLSEEKNLGFLELMAKTNTEKITREILEGLSLPLIQENQIGRAHV